MDVKSTLGGFFKVTDIGQGSYEVTTPILIFANYPFSFFIRQDHDTCFITDNSFIITYLSQIFALNSPDVKDCIKEVLMLNRVHMKKGEIFVVSKNEQEFKTNLSNFLIVVSQLIRMQAFFDKN